MVVGPRAISTTGADHEQGYLKEVLSELAQARDYLSSSVVVETRKAADLAISLGARLAGHVITYIAQDGPAHIAGAQVGWAVMEIAGRKIRCEADIADAFSRAPQERLKVRCGVHVPEHDPGSDTDGEREDPARRPCPYCGRQDLRDWARHVAHCSLAESARAAIAPSWEAAPISPRGGLLQGLSGAASHRARAGSTTGDLRALAEVSKRILKQHGLLKRRVRSPGSGSPRWFGGRSDSSDSDPEPSRRPRAWRRQGPAAAAAGAETARLLAACDAGVAASAKPLRWIKALFSSRLNGWAGGVGVPDHDFAVHFAPLLGGDRGVAAGDEAARTRACRELATRIDTDANGLIDWEEFSSFLLSRRTGGGADACELAGVLYTAHEANREQPHRSAPGTPAASHPHKENAHRIVAPRACQSVDRYYTASRDGTVKVWSAQSLRYETTLHNDTTEERSGFIVDVACLPISNRVLVCQVDRTLTLYDAASNALHRVYRGWLTRSDTGYVPQTKPFLEERQTREQKRKELIDNAAKLADDHGRQREPVREDHSHLGAGKRLNQWTRAVNVIPMEGMDNSPLCCEAVQPDHQRKLFPSLAEPLLCGLDQGFVHLYNMRGSGTGHTSQEEGCLRRSHCWRPHKGWVTHVTCCDRLDSIITSSTDEFLHVTSLEKGEKIQSLGGPGVLCSACTLDGRPRHSAIYGFDYLSGDYGLIATHGASRSVMLWRPTMQNPVERLEHKCPVVAVRFNQQDSHCIVLTRDKLLSVYDLRTFRALDQIEDKQHRWPDNWLSALDFDERRRSILAVANTPIAHRSKIAIDEERSAALLGYSPAASPRRGAGGGDQPHRGDRSVGHSEPVVAVLHNGRFGHLVTADARRVFVWDSVTGSKISGWSPSKEAVQGGMTTVVFDSAKRRMLTASQQGQVAVWNYMTGEQLKEMRNPYSFELTCVQHLEVSGITADVSAVLVACGWSQAVLFFVDSPGEFFVPLYKELRLNDDYGHVYSVAQAGSRLAFGMQGGQSVIYDVSMMVIYAVLPAITGCGGCPPTPTGSIAGSQGGVASRRQSSRRGSFGETYSDAQHGLSGIVEQLHMLSPCALVTLNGAGAVCIWRVGHKGTSEPLAAVRASFRAGDEAFTMCVAAGDDRRIGDDGSGRLWIGDASGVVTLLLAGSAFAAAKEQVQAGPFKEQSQSRPLGAQRTATSDRAQRGDRASFCTDAHSPLTSPALRQDEGFASPTARPGTDAADPSGQPGFSATTRGAAGRRPPRVQAPADGAGGQDGGRGTQQHAETQAVLQYHITVAACWRAHSKVVCALCWLPAQRILACAGADGTVLLSTARGRPLAEVGRMSGWPLGGPRRAPGGISSDGGTDTPPSGDEGDPDRGEGDTDDEAGPSIGDDATDLSDPGSAMSPAAKSSSTAVNSTVGDEAARARQHPPAAGAGQISVSHHQWSVRAVAIRRAHSARYELGGARSGAQWAAAQQRRSIIRAVTPRSCREETGGGDTGRTVPSEAPATASAALLPGRASLASSAPNVPPATGDGMPSRTTVEASPRALPQTAPRHFGVPRLKVPTGPNPEMRLAAPSPAHAGPSGGRPAVCPTTGAGAVALLTPRPPPAAQRPPRLKSCGSSEASSPRAPSDASSALKPERRPHTARFTRAGLLVKEFRNRPRPAGGLAVRDEMQRVIVPGGGNNRAVRRCSVRPTVRTEPFAPPPRPHYSVHAAGPGGSDITQAELAALSLTRAEPWTRRSDFLPRETARSRPPCFLGEQVRAPPKRPTSAPATARTPTAGTAAEQSPAGSRSPSPSPKEKSPTGASAHFFLRDRLQAEKRMYERQGATFVGENCRVQQLKDDFADRGRARAASQGRMQQQACTQPRTDIATQRPFAEVLCSRKGGCVGGVHACGAHKLPDGTEVCKAVFSEKLRKAKQRDELRSLELYIRHLY
eukprot:TRINITY_DN4115_c0_g2_i1.p1 TRINITY_DN4115_c0_g2~~TRINITY_DN4115_c0_g2_i1.p1  ORF type:complete len:1960 (+),score=468.46 TRINITY_DN4115_c0_g2_i1:88-5880(+)